MSRSLLLKGLVGVGVVAGAGSLVVFREKIFGVGEEGEDLSGFKHKELIEKVGLECGLEEGVNEIADNTIKDCSVKSGGTINVEVEGKKEEGVSFTSNTSKLKVSKNKDYSGGLRFVVDSGDLDLTKGEGTPTHFQKLEQFETYEVKKVRDKFYLKRRTEAKEGKKDALGLEKCILPKAGDSECSLTTEGEIKAVKFEKQESEQISLTSGTVTLKISKSGDTTTFTDGYRFTFTFPQEITINGKVLKANTPYDFKIKKHDNSNTLTLEKAWTEDNAFAKKAGLTCTGSNNKECSVSTEAQNLNVKVGDKKKEGITTTTGGKIKMETDKPGYNQGLKFSISERDVTLTGGTGEVEKLEELETYEITEEGGKFYLSIKTSKKDAIESSLSIPEGCELPTSNDSVKCTLDDAKFKAINFKDKSSPSSNGTVNLTISKATNITDFPLGYKFTFETEKEATVKTDTKIKANIPTDFKIKKGAGNALSLEKAWTAASLGNKVGLTCNTSKNECTIGSTLKVKQVNKNESVLREKSLTKSSGDGKIRVTKDQVGYNQGFKFEITDASITLSGSTAAEESDKINSLGEFETYEIKEDGGEWYLERKDRADDFIKKQLKIGSICTGSFPETFGVGAAPLTCNDITNINVLKKIKFEGGDSYSWTKSTDPINVQLAIDKDTSLPGGFKFTFIDNGKSGTQLCIPTGSGSINLNDSSNAGGVEYKIKKSGANNKTLSLVKKTP